MLASERSSHTTPVITATRRRQTFWTRARSREPVSPLWDRCKRGRESQRGLRFAVPPTAGRADHSHPDHRVDFNCLPHRALPSDITWRPLEPIRTSGFSSEQQRTRPHSRASLCFHRFPECVFLPCFSHKVTAFYGSY